MDKQITRKAIALLLGVVLMLGCAGLPHFTAHAESLTFAEIQQRINVMGPADVLTIDGKCVASKSDSCLVIPSGSRITLNITGTLDRHISEAGPTNNGCVIFVQPQATLTLTGGGTITGGFSSTGGGGIYNAGTLIIDNIVISGNVATTSNGGGIYNAGSLTINGGSITENGTGYTGAGIYSTGELTINGGTIRYNMAYTGGGVYASGKINMSGSPVIVNNMDTKGTSNLYLDGSVISVTSPFEAGAEVHLNVTDKTGGCVFTSGYWMYNKGRMPSSVFFTEDDSYQIQMTADGEACFMNKSHVIRVLPSEYAIGERVTDVVSSFSDEMKAAIDHIEDFTLEYFGGTLSGGGINSPFSVGEDQSSAAVYEKSGEFLTDGFTFPITVSAADDLPVGVYKGSMNYWAHWTNTYGEKESYNGSVTLTLTVPGYTVTCNDSEGTVSVSPEFPIKAGSTVTLRVTPDATKALLDISAVDSRGKQIEVTRVGGLVYTFVMPDSDVTVSAKYIRAIAYLTPEGGVLTLQEPYTVVNGEDNVWTSGWYVLSNSCSFFTDKDDPTYGPVNIEGDVNLILCEAKEMRASNIIVEGDSRLTIWAQSVADFTFNSSGRLTVESADSVAAGIGASSSDKTTGTITINGGTIKVNQKGDGAAIGGAYTPSTKSTAAAGTIIINGGLVDATAKFDSASPAIGGNGGSVTITGGIVTLSGGNGRNLGITLRDIGGEKAAVSISGGRVNANQHGIMGSSIELSYQERATSNELSISAQSFNGPVKVRAPFKKTTESPTTVSAIKTGDYSGSELGRNMLLVPITGNAIVTFDTGGTSVIPDQVVRIGDRAQKPEDPKAPGFLVFDGWHLVKDGVVQSDEFSFMTAVTEDITLKAVYVEDIYGAEGYRFETVEDAPIIYAHADDSVIDACLTDEEIENGYGLLILSSPLAESDVPQTDKERLVRKASGLGATVGTWFDISLYKLPEIWTDLTPQVMQQAEKITEIPSPVELTSEVPDSLLKDGRTYYLLACHDGEVTVCDEGSEPSFSWDTDRFSTYLIAYRDTADYNVPSTGVSATRLLASLVCIAGLAFLPALPARKRRSSRNG